jgi:hypothetical protein
MTFLQAVQSENKIPIYHPKELQGCCDCWGDLARLGQGLDLKFKKKYVKQAEYS